MTTKSNYSEIHNEDVEPALGKNLSSAVQKCIKDIVTKEDLKCYSVSVNDISTNGGNYLGDLKTVDIIGHGADGAKEINLFFKNMVEGTEEVSLISISDVYSRERFMYSNILPIYNKLQEEYKVPQEERFNIVRHYNVPCSDDVIIMENLSKKGFETLHRHEVISLKFGELSIAQLAKLHALSFVLKRTQPEYFEKNVQSLKTHIAVESNWQEFIKKMCDYSIEALEGDDKVKLTHHVPTLLRRFQEYAIDNTEDAVCLCHGDFRANNILLNRTEGEISAVVAIDYQFSSYLNPVLDVIYFIFSATDQKFRDEYMQRLKSHYYDNLDKFLSYFGIQSEDVYPRKRFEADFKAKLDFGLISFILLVPFLFTNDDDVADVKELMDSQKHDLSLNNGYKKRVREVVSYFIREGFVN